MRNRRNLIIGALCFIVTALNMARARQAGDEWPMFRGNHRLSGVTANPLPDLLKLLWTYETEGSIESSAAIVNGVVYVGSQDGYLHAVDLRTGKLRWKYQTKGAVGESSPSVQNGIDLEKWEARWSYRHRVRKFPFYSSAAVTSDRIFVGGRDKMLHCLERPTGKAVWTFATRARVESSPLVAGSRVYFGSNDGRLYGLDMTSGQKIFEFELGSPLTASPAASMGSLVIGSRDGGLFCFGNP